MRFFSKYRLATIFKNGNLKKYLTYALGELVLVVAGILIALALNNWKERSDALEKERETLNEVSTQLSNDIIKIEEYLSDLKKLENTFNKFFGLPHDSLVSSDEDIVRLLIHVNSLELTDRASILLNESTFDDKKFSTLAREIDATYKSYLSDLEAMEAILIEAVRENLSYVRQNTDWYIDFVVNLDCSSDCYNFIMTDNGYAQGMANLKFLYSNGYGGIVRKFYRELNSYETRLEEALNRQ